MTDQQVIVHSFDYAALDIETRVFVQQQTREIKSLMRTTVRNIIDIGQMLLDVKAKLEHGQFGDWLQTEFSWSQRTAYNYMAVTEKFATVANLDQYAPAALYLLAAPSTPNDVIDEMQQKADEGEHVTKKTVKAAVDATKPKPDFAAAIERAASFITDRLQSGKEHRNILEREARQTGIGLGDFSVALERLLKSGTIASEGAFFRLTAQGSPNADRCAQIIALLREEEVPLSSSEIIDRLHLDSRTGWHAINLLLTEVPPRIRAVKGTGRGLGGFILVDDAPPAEVAAGEPPQDSAAELDNAPPEVDRHDATWVTAKVLDVLRERGPLTIAALREAVGYPPEGSNQHATWQLVVKDMQRRQMQSLPSWRTLGGGQIAYYDPAITPDAAQPASVADELRARFDQSQITLVGDSDDGAWHRAIEVARKLVAAGQWDGQAHIELDAVELHARLFGIEHLDPAALVEGRDFFIVPPATATAPAPAAPTTAEAAVTSSRTFALSEGLLVTVEHQASGYVVRIEEGRERYVGYGDTRVQALDQARSLLLEDRDEPASPEETINALNRAQIMACFDAADDLLVALKQAAVAAQLLADVPPFETWMDPRDRSAIQHRLANLLDAYAIVQPGDPDHPILRAERHAKALAASLKEEIPA